ncbi:hypothetical protein I553_5381 [Mycobacterium xenopi 4042]|uniref:Uncharacterized protein n=1 Tax=Mycobacterium xenopi 4042 TaxID=1299334 RepID=X7ZX90_MYCXE|nr:hypothetical protein I553_5381 [Mycobacterium xenopi 4042]
MPAGAGSCSTSPRLGCSRLPRSAKVTWRRAASTAGLDTAGGLGRPATAGLQTASTPEVYHDVLADVPARDQIVKVGQVQLVGRDDSQPAGSQDTFLLDDSTLAWGQINDPSSSAQIKVTRTQSLPGVGPTDNGSFLVALAGYEEPTRPSEPWWPSVLGYGGLALAVGLAAWMLSRAYGAHT